VTHGRDPTSGRLAELLAHDGFAILRDAFDASTVDALQQAVAPLAATTAGMRGGVRHLLRDVPAVRTLAASAPVRHVAEAALGPDAFAVRAILFDKKPGANWKVIWHQDLTIAVSERRDVAGFGPWSEKDGVPHVQPPPELLARMVAVRVHLDDCTETNGPVRVIPRSHRSGRLSAAEVDRFRAAIPDVVCTVPRGGILALPLADPARVVAGAGAGASPCHSHRVRWRRVGRAAGRARVVRAILTVRRRPAVGLGREPRDLATV
jgi:hypothetical protein